MNEILSEILKALIAALVPVIGTVMIYLTKKVLEYLDSKTNNELLKTIEHEGGEIVLAVESEIVSKAKEAASDGKITQAELEEVFARAKNKALELLNLRLKNYPAGIANVVSQKASEFIEAQLMKQKASGTIQVKLPANPQPAQVSL